MCGRIRIWILVVGIAVLISFGPLANASDSSWQGVVSTTRIVTSRLDSGPGSLRQALLDAQPNDRILFDPVVFPPANPAVIMILDPLPTLVQSGITIDGSDAGVILDGRYAPGYSDGLLIRSDHNVIKGLQIIGFPDDAIELSGGASNNLIGGDWRVGRAPRGEGNILTRNRGSGVEIEGSGAVSNTVSGNLVGLDADGTEDFRILALAISPSYRSDHTVFLGTRYHGVWRSSDGGETWQATGNDLADHAFVSLVLSPVYAADGTVFAGAADGSIFRTTDRGSSWEQGTGDTIKRSVVRLGISPNYAADGTIFAATDGEGIFISRDRGASWRASNAGVTNRLLHALEVSPGYAADRTVVAAAWDTVYKSADGGATWMVVNEKQTDGITLLAMSPNYRQDQTLYLARRVCNTDDVIWRSTDGGQHWISLRANPGWCTPRAIALAPDFEQSATIFLVDDWGGIFRSTDGGESWAQVFTSHYNWTIGISPAYDQDKSIFVGTRMGLALKSADRGMTWADMANTLSEQGNAEPGVFVRNGAQWNVIGGASPGARNIIGRNGNEGIVVMDAGTDYNLIGGNLVGVTTSGRPAGNGIDGVTIKGGAQHNRIGGGTEGDGNVISANGGQGVVLIHAGTADNDVQGNLIGTAPDGHSLLGNAEAGILITEGAHDNLIGGTTPQARNIVSGNEGNGIGIWSASTDNTIIGNLIGVDVTGMQAVGNRYQGIALGLGAHHNRIGGSSPAERNLISGNGSNGISIWNTGTAHNLVLGNLVGVDTAGRHDIPNKENGVLIAGGATDNRVGGLTPGEGNVLSGNVSAGISLTGAGTARTQILGNTIGLTANGDQPLGNYWGISCWDDSEQTTIEGNRIGGNLASGIQMADSHRNTVRTNLIGTDTTGSIQLGNLDNGVGLLMGARENTIGPSNVIAFNAHHGVGVWDASTQRNTITANSVFANGERGIRVDLGANGVLSRPAITSVESVAVRGIAPVANAYVEVFSDEATQGRVFEGNTTADSDGVWALVKPAGFNDAYLTATATDGTGNTSEFSMPAGRPREQGSDRYEPDDSCTQGRALPLDGTQQLHTFHHTGDVDWVVFDATGGRKYLIEAAIPAGSHADVTLSVFGGCAGPALGGQDHTFSPGVRLTFAATASGPLHVKLNNHTPEVAGAEVSYTISVRAVDEATVRGAAIIVAGRLTENDELQPNIHWVSNAAYRMFTAQAYSPDHIYYLATDPTLDATYDGHTDVTARTTASALHDAITNWAKERVGPDRALTLYLVDHGDPKMFYLDKPRGEFLTPSELHSWLSELETTRPGTKVNIIYEACFSGSFVTMPQSVSRVGRVVLTSTGAANLARATDRGAVFSEFFLDALGRGQSLFGSFQAAQWAIAQSDDGQTPWLDANGNGIPNEIEDEVEAARRGFSIAGTFPGNTDRWPPYITQARIVQPVVGARAVLRAEVRDDVTVVSVWATIYPPSYEPPGTGNQWVRDDLPRVPLMPTGDGWYEGLYEQFNTAGEYTIVVYAEDNLQLGAQPVGIRLAVGAQRYVPILLR